MNRSNREVQIVADLKEISKQAAEIFVRVANASDRATIALSGGSTPAALYALLATPDYFQRIPWSKVHLFWGDERCVPPDHSDSNYRMVREKLLSHIAIPEENVHRMKGEIDPPAGAADYEKQLAQFFGASTLPRFDLNFLGLGDDGHTASLFPGTAALQETQRWVVENFVPRMKSWRLTLTYPVLNNAAQTVFLISGAAKAPVLKQVLESSEQIYPSQRIQPENGTLLFLVDRAASAA
jgi:6-phosphogluconolactonase